MEKRPFGFRDKIGYLFGDFGNDFTFILSTVILMKFYTDVVGISAGAVGTIMMIARFADAFTDVTMGRICDRSRAVEGVGKFKPWIRRIVSDLSERDCASAVCAARCVSVCDVHPLGIGVLYGDQHPLRLDGLRHIGGPQRQAEPVDVSVFGRVAGGRGGGRAGARAGV